MNRPRAEEAARGLPRVIGHRGAGVLAPENTLAALKLAASLGLTWVELDVQVGEDGSCVLFHDLSLERTTDGRGLLAETPIERLRQLDAGSWFADRFRGEPVPMLEDAIACLAELGLSANVEIKCDAGYGKDCGERVARCLLRSWPRGSRLPLVSSFDEDALSAVATATPAIERALLVDEVPEDWRDRLRRLGASALHCVAGRLHASSAHQVVQAGIALRAFTVNDADAAQRLFDLGAESVFTDQPDQLLRRWPSRP